MRRELESKFEGILPNQEIRLPPFRPLDDFILKATWKVPDFSNLAKLNNRVLSNLIYYQTNYFVFGIALFLLIGWVQTLLAFDGSIQSFSINYPIDFLFGLSVVATVLMGFVYVSSTAQTTNNALATIKQILRSAQEDRPIIVLIGILGVSYLIFSFLGKLFIFVCGIILPVQGSSQLISVAFEDFSLPYHFSNFTSCDAP